jgi:excisionase family DNA binding protein
MADDDELMTVQEAREYMGVARGTMTRLLKTGVLPTLGPDPLNRRSKLVRKSDVDALLARSKRSAVA